MTLDTPLRRGDDAIVIDGQKMSVPELREDPGAPGVVLGVRPEHIAFSDASKVRGVVFSVEYLGTTQIVTIKNGHGMLKARAASTARVHAGESVGLTFRSDMLSLFDPTSGRAIKTALHERRPSAGGYHG